MVKTALVMGASGDIGTACVKQLAASGWNVICHYYRNQEKIVNLIKELQKHYFQQDFFMVSLNMLAESELKEFLQNLFQVDAIVFASGFTYYKLLTELKINEMEALWQIHLKTPLILLQNLQGKLASSNFGRVVFIGSVYGQTGSSMESVYSAVKGAQIAFAKSYAKEVATLGITVNVVAVGAVDTRMNKNWTKAELKNLKEAIPLGRMAETTEIAAVVDFLVSKKASYITGSVISVDGGWNN